MAYPLIPPKSQWVDENGDPMSGGYMYFYDPATDNLKNTYPTADDADAQTNANSNPVVLDSRGEASIFLEDGETYKVTLYDVGGTLLWTVDDVIAASAPDAAGITITDAGGYYAASNVEAALQELGASTGAGIIGIADGGGYFSSTDVEGALAELYQDIGATRSSGSFTPTFGGFSADPVGTNTVIWMKQNGIVYVDIEFTTGTSNATSFTITNWPSAIQRTDAGSPLIMPLPNLVDNGVTSWGTIQVTNSATVIFKYEGGLWTASGAKGVYSSGGFVTFSYPLSMS
jgi:hypothetical protein